MDYMHYVIIYLPNILKSHSAGTGYTLKFKSKLHTQSIENRKITNE